MAPRRSGRGCPAEQRDQSISANALRRGYHHPSSSTSSAMSIEVTVDTLEGDTTASLRQATIDLAEKVLVIEERTLFLGDVIKLRRGTKVENFIRRQEKIRHESK